MHGKMLLAVSVVSATGVDAFQPHRFPGLAHGTRSTRRRYVPTAAAGLLISPAKPASPSPLEIPTLKSLGMPKVHRYLRDDGESWAMWFQGRDDEIDPEVVSLSTGRIYRATSDDGLAWTIDKCSGPGGASFDIDTEQWWGFDTAHIGLGDVRLTASEKIMTQGGMYLLYYFGGSYAAQPATDFMNLPNVPAEGEIPEVVGMQLKIGIAMSQDGQTWGRFEGEHSSGAVLEVGEEGEFDALTVGWPTVVNDGKDFFMYYQTMRPSTSSTGSEYLLGLAKSPDGFRWKKQGPVSVTGEGMQSDGFSAKGVARRHVFMRSSSTLGGASDLFTAADVDMAKEGKEDAFSMFYEGVDASGRHAIGLATSSDGINWSAFAGNPIFTPADGDQWDSKAVGSPNIVEMGGGKLRMYYSGTSKDGTCGIGCAEGSVDDLSKWERCEVSVSPGAAVPSIADQLSTAIGE